MPNEIEVGDEITTSKGSQQRSKGKIKGISRRSRNTYKQKSLSQQGVSYEEMCAKHRASLKLNNPRPTITAPSSSLSPKYQAPVPSQIVIELSPSPVPGTEDSPPPELVRAVDDLSYLPIPNP